MIHFVHRFVVPPVFILAVLFAVTGAARAEAPFAAPAVPPDVHYAIDLNVAISGETAHFAGAETIHLVNRSTRPLPALVLSGPFDSADRLGVTIAGASVTAVPLSDTGTLRRYLVSLPAPLAPGASLDLAAAFSFDLPADRLQSIGMPHWHPALWWGYSTHSDFDVAVTVPTGYTLGTSGRLDPATGRFTARGANAFGLYLGKGRQVLEADAGGVLVRAIFTEAARPAAEALLATAVDAIGFCRDWLGFYPYASLTIIPGEDNVMGGSPVASALVSIHSEEVIARQPADQWRWIMAHEIGHQYWGEYVLERDDPGWVWLGMGLRTDREYALARGLTQGSHREYLDNWIGAVRQGLDTTIARNPDTIGDLSFDYNSVVSHAKGYTVVSALESMLGDEMFDRVYRRCLSEFGGRRLGAADLQRLAEEESGLDLEDFFAQWVRSDCYPSYEIASTEAAERDGRWVSTVTVKCGGTLRMPVPVEAVFADGSRQVQSIDGLADTGRVTFTSGARLESARLDPQGALPLVVPPVTQEAIEVTAAVRDLDWTGSGDEALRIFARAKSAGLIGGSLWLKLGLALYDGRHYNEAAEAFAVVIADPGSPSREFDALVWEGHIADITGRRDDALAFYRRALEKAGDYRVQHSQYGMHIDADWVRARLESPFTRE